MNTPEDVKINNLENNKDQKTLSSENAQENEITQEAFLNWLENEGSLFKNETTKELNSAVSVDLDELTVEKIKNETNIQNQINTINEEAENIVLEGKSELIAAASQQEQKENAEFSEEDRKYLSDLFVESLKNEKNNVEHIKEDLFPGPSFEAFKNLMIFSGAIQTLSQDAKVPEKQRRILRVLELDLSPVGAFDIVPGVNSYPHAVLSILEILDNLLTKEVSLAVHAYAQKIFVPPAEEYARNGPK